jgi:hypothetical protein
MVFLWREDADDAKGIAWKLEQLRPHLSIVAQTWFCVAVRPLTSESHDDSATRVTIVFPETWRMTRGPLAPGIPLDEPICSDCIKGFYLIEMSLLYPTNNFESDQKSWD